jgi:NADH-quinone oxidoreductase subunit E
MWTDETLVMLTTAETEAIEAIARRYENKQGASIEALREVQRSRGWVSDENLRDVARLLDMSADELDGVATFYNLIFRRPVGRHVILLCDSVSCWIMGCEALRRGIESRLDIKAGETTADGRFTLLPTVCLGACDHAPVMMVDDDLIGGLEIGQLDEVLARFR